MKISVDTNVLLRSFIGDNQEQSELSENLQSRAEKLMLPVTMLCELVWVLGRNYHYNRTEIIEAMEVLLGATNVVTNTSAAEAGLATLRAGGDFADGVIAYEGRALGADSFFSFDNKAVKLWREQGFDAQSPNDLSSVPASRRHE